jgi:site-specific DNA recombinase
LFDQVQEIRQKNRELHSGKPTHDYLLRGHARCGYCGTPLVGSFMNKRFRYYHCRATYPTAKRTKTCDAKYIRADYLEDLAWQGIRKVLEKPQVVLAGVKEQLAIEQKNCVQGVPLDKEIEQLRKKIKGYDSQEKRLVQLLRYNEVDENFVLDEMNKIKADRQADKQILESFIKTKERMESLEKVEVKLSEYCQRLKHDLDSASYQDKCDVLDMLAIKITATTEAVSVDGIIPIEPTSKQSSGDSEATHHWTNMGMTTWM